MIEISPSYYKNYYYRALIKHEIKDYKGAIADYTKSIELNPNDDAHYFNASLRRYRTPKIRKDYRDAYKNRARSKHEIKDYNGACEDLKKPKGPELAYRDYCSNGSNDAPTFPY